MRAKTSKGVQSRTAENHCSFRLYSFQPISLKLQPNSSPFLSPIQVWIEAQVRPTWPKKNQDLSIFFTFFFTHLPSQPAPSATCFPHDMLLTSSPLCCLLFLLLWAARLLLFLYKCLQLVRANLPSLLCPYSSSSTCSTPPSTSYCSSCW